MSKLVVVGNKGLTLPLTAVGFEPVAAGSATELENALDRLSVDEDLALVVCGETQAAGCPEAVLRFRKNAHGVVLVVPDGPESRRTGWNTIRQAIERAAGVDLLSKSR